MKTLVKYSILSFLFFSIPTLSNALPECEGTFHNCTGIKTWENGDEYYGEFKNNKKHGYGTYYYKSGSEYDGDWKNGKKHGIGYFYWNNGDKYGGYWLNDKMNGKGKYTFADGDKYIGNYLNNKRHGKGTYTYKNGDKYVGDWVNGKRTGKGIFTFADGTKQEGVFRDSKFLFSEKIDKNQNINDSNNPISLALKQKPVEIKKTTKKVSKDNNSISSALNKKPVKINKPSKKINKESNNSISSALNKKPVKINKPSKKINKESNNSISQGLSKKPVEVKKPIKANKPIKKINKKIVKNKSINDKPFKIIDLNNYNSTKSIGWDKVNPAIKFLIKQRGIDLEFFGFGRYKIKDVIVEKASRCFIKLRHILPVSEHDKHGKVEKFTINFNNINWKAKFENYNNYKWTTRYECPEICYGYYGHGWGRKGLFGPKDTIGYYAWKDIKFTVEDSMKTRFNNAMSDIRKSCNASTSKY